MSNAVYYINSGSGVSNSGATSHDPLNPNDAAVADFVKSHAQEIDANHNGKITHAELRAFAKTHQSVVQAAHLPSSVHLGGHANKGFSWRQVAGSSVAKSGSQSSTIKLVNKNMKQWQDEILSVAKISGVDPALIAGIMWHESRGNAGTNTNNPGDHSIHDVSLMQTSNTRWREDVLGTLSTSEKQAVKQLTGVDASKLDMNNPLHNIIGGAFCYKWWEGMAHGDVTKALTGYNSGDFTNSKGWGIDGYARRVLNYADCARKGTAMPDTE